MLNSILSIKCRYRKKELFSICVGIGIDNSLVSVRQGLDLIQLEQECSLRKVYMLDLYLQVLDSQNRYFVFLHISNENLGVSQVRFFRESESLKEESGFWETVISLYSKQVLGGLGYICRVLGYIGINKVSI